MDRYAKLRKIGEGAFGKAELVKRKENGVQYVIKQINISRMGSKEREDSRKEVAVLAQLNHPHIVAYQESFEEVGNLYIVMDYCSGGDLYARINNQRGALFTEDQILDWFAQMCLAIKHIHDRKILHRDIKSQNIFLTGRGLVQLGDFGIAKVLNNTVELARTCIGTPYYLSPEICENKPYNNKSDIWSLGCVLYELATLKHAFEAGNMKNLVLKIIRGSYPPLSPKYSYELRNLVTQLFKRAPRDRPSINSVLKKPIISQRIPKFLTSEQLASEFSHTVMHGQKLARALPPPPKPAARPPSASRNRPEAVPAGAAKRYDPSKIYGQPVVRKSKENRSSSDMRKRPGSAGSRPGSAAGSRPGSAAGARPASAQDKNVAKNKKHPNIWAPPSPNKDLAKKRQELYEKERKRREDDRKKQEEKKRQSYERRHKDLQEKQRMDRMNKAREEGWKGLIGSLESDRSGDGNQKNGAPKELGREPPRAAPKPAPGFRGIPPGGGGDYNMNAAQKDRGKYEHYNQYLDKLQQDREVRQHQDNVPAPAPAAAYMGAPRVVPGAPQPGPVWRKAPEPTPVYRPYNQRGQNQQQERAKLVEDFISRRQEAQYNRQRGQAELFGQGQARQNRPPSAGNRYSPAEQNRPSSADNRNREEQEYLEKLRQIRQQNYNERKNLQAKAEMDKNPQLAAEERKKKAEALKKQAEDWAKQRKDVLEHKRQELFAKERQLKELRQNGNRPAVPQFKPSPAVPMTGAMNAIGVTPKVVPEASNQAKGPAMTNVLGAIGATPRVVEDDSRPKTPIQKQKDEILRKLNEKGPPQNSEESQESARSKWGAAGELKIAEQEPERPSWAKAPAIDLGKLTLEETGSQMEVTSARDRVILNPASARKQWGKPGDTVLNALQGAALSETTATTSTNSDGSVTSPPMTGGETPAKPAVGATITISKSAIQKGTITICKADTQQPQENKETAESFISSPASPTEGSEAAANQNPSSEILTNQNDESKPDKFKISTIPEVTEKSQLDLKINPETVNSQKPPVASKKPPVADKPLIFPKPVLLPKPDTPKEFAPSQPVSVKSEGAGALFEKVEADREETNKEKTIEHKAESQDKTVVHDIEGEKPQSGTGLKLGLTMGSFDAPHRELLRTCSEPDLASLFKTLHNNTAMVRVRSLDEMSAVEEDEDDSLAAVYSSMEQARESAEKEVVSEGEDGGGDNEGQQEEEVQEEDEDIADLLSVRETMQSLLLDDSEEDSKKSPIKFSLSSDRESRGDTNDGDIEDTEEEDSHDIDEEDGVGDGDDEENDENDSVENDDEHDGFEDEENHEEKEEHEGEQGDEKVIRSHSVDNENPQTPEEQRDVMSELFQTDESDDEFDDGEDVGDFDLFGRLEESRAELEEELGAEKLIKVYKTVQALQEDEDENMEEGARIAQELLGKEKEHLYPKIFQLVMADAAFTDDNLS